MNVFVTILGIIGALIVITIIVVAHEFGHYAAGRKLKFKILEFAVGFGPKLIKWVRDGILFSVRALPIGGYTRFYGEDEVIDDKWAFNKQPVGKRAVVIAAGPIMNIILAWVLAAFFLCAFGDYTPNIAAVSAGSPAEAAGFMAGDKVLYINGGKIDFSIELSEYLVTGFDKPPTIIVERNGNMVELKDIPTTYDEKTDRNIIGVEFGSKHRYYGFFEAIGLSFKWLFSMIKQMISYIFRLIFTGRGAGYTMGIIGTISVIGFAIRTSFETVITLGALLSINLAIVNLLPFPALDGGRLIFLAIEAIRKKPLPKNAEGYMNFAGFIALMALMVLLTYQDITRLVT